MIKPKKDEHKEPKKKAENWDYDSVETYLEDMADHKAIQRQGEWCTGKWNDVLRNAPKGFSTVVKRALAAAAAGLTPLQMAEPVDNMSDINILAFEDGLVIASIDGQTFVDENGTKYDKEGRKKRLKSAQKGRVR